MLQHSSSANRWYRCDFQRNCKLIGFLVIVLKIVFMLQIQLGNSERNFKVTVFVFSLIFLISYL